MNEKKYFVLDLFVIKAVESSDLDLYGRAMTILQLIKDKCHKILVTPKLAKEYNQRLKKLNRSRFANDKLLKKIKGLLINSDKVVVEQEPKHLNLSKFIGVPEDDLIIVETALSKSGVTVIIVTTNRKHLRDNEQLREYLRKHGVKVLVPMEAINEL